MREADYFADEIRKLGFKITPAIGATLTSAAMGGAWRGDAGYQKARQEGKSRTEALTSALKGGAKGALGGAALGGALVGGSRYLKGGLGSKAKGGVDAFYNLGGQQVHALTGYGGKRGARAFGGGSAMSERMRDAAVAHEKNMSQRFRDNPSWWRKRRLKSATEGIGRAEAGIEATRKAEEMGLTSMPGTVRSLKEYGLRPTVRAAWDSQMKGMGPGNKAFLFGVPAAFGVVGAVKDKEHAGASLGESAGMAASNVLPAAMSPSMLGAFSPAAHLMPTFLMSRPFMAAGKQVGKGADWARNKVRGGGEQ